MGHRLSKIYTRTGDNGTTGLGNGDRIDKDAIRIDCIGDIDELNSVIGLLVADLALNELTALLVEIQHDLFDAGGELSIPGHCIISSKQVEYVEHRLDELNKDLPPLKDFILPGGSSNAAVCHLARSVCRRAERHLVSLNRSEPLSPDLMKYFNRLSDLLFVLARAINQSAGQKDVLWNPKRNVQS